MTTSSASKRKCSRRFSASSSRSSDARAEAERLYLAAIRQICRFLRPERYPAVIVRHSGSADR